MDKTQKQKFERGNCKFDYPFIVAIMQELKKYNILKSFKDFNLHNKWENNPFLEGGADFNSNSYLCTGYVIQVTDY